MPIYDAQSIPEKVSTSAKDPEIAEWLKTGPVLGAQKPIHIQRREHDAFDEVKPPIGQIEHLAMAQSRFESITSPSPARPRAVQ
jgi:hypothetical protein